MCENDHVHEKTGTIYVFLHLWMSRDSHDARFVHVQYGFVDCSDFKQVEGGGVEEEEGDEGKDPNEFMHSGHCA